MQINNSYMDYLEAKEKNKVIKRQKKLLEYVNNCYKKCTDYEIGACLIEVSRFLKEELDKK